jgi:hypothetical protein
MISKLLEWAIPDLERSSQVNKKRIERKNRKDIMSEQVLKGAENNYTREDVVDAIDLLVDICHSASVRGGWWNDLTTGEPLERNKLEMLALIHSEVSEATEGVRKGINDDHLPQYPMETVEIADMFVRGFDYAGGHGLTVGEAFFDKILYNANRADHKPENRMKEGGKKS